MANNYAVNIQNNGNAVPVVGALLLDPAAGAVPAPNYGIDFQVNGQRVPVVAMMVIDPVTGLPGSLGGGGSAPGGAAYTLQYNNAGALGGMSGSAWDDVNRSLVIAGATVTTSKPLLDLAQTWNAGAVVFSALKLNVTDTASSSSSTLLDLQVGGVSKFNISKIGSLATAGSIAAYSLGLWSVSDAGGIFLGASSDVVLKRDAANQLALRNGANAQTFNVYNTYTDAANYERGGLLWSGNFLYLTTGAAGTGIARSLVVTSSGTTYLGSSGGNQWFINASTGHWLANIDNTYDIGANGANRPRNVHVAGYVLSGSAIASGASAGIGWNGRSQMYSTADGTVVLENAAGTSFSLLQLGGTTSSFPAIKRNGAAINFRLADDSADAAVTVSTVKTVGVTVANLLSAATAGAGARSFVTDASATTFGTTVAGSGANKVPVYSDGTNWIIG